ncbi:hypothetical protein HU200_062342 [Digitaria exilis]|uniref:Uncharacterized protein n=1 Tax=Digitaria exilis TaxID=1010633 RepID=A0A835A582_9POAL|nr:hypothetical protein HU200_062342 [Digitaria exilis]
MAFGRSCVRACLVVRVWGELALTLDARSCGGRPYVAVVGRGRRGHGVPLCAARCTVAANHEALAPGLLWWLSPSFPFFPSRRESRRAVTAGRRHRSIECPGSLVAIQLSRVALVLLALATPSYFDRPPCVSELYSSACRHLLLSAHFTSQLFLPATAVIECVVAILCHLVRVRFSEMRRSSQGSMMTQSYDAGSGRGLLASYVKATKPRPSKWDDAQRWLSSSSRAAPDDDRRRSSCADDRLLLPSASMKGARHSWSSVDGATASVASGAREDGEAETKRMDSVLVSYVNQPRCLSLRDIGTEMTPAGSKEPSRANTPRAVSLQVAEPSPPSSTAGRRRRPSDAMMDGGSTTTPGRHAGCERDADSEEREGDAAAAVSSPATAWDAAERAKHMAR